MCVVFRMDPKTVMRYGKPLGEGETTHLGGTGVRNVQVKGQEHGLMRKEMTFMHMVGERLGRVMDSANKKIPEILFNILSKPATSRVAGVLGCDEWETVFKPIAGHLIVVGGGPNDQMHPAVKEYFAKSMWMHQQPGDKCHLEAIDVTSSAVKEFIKPDELAKRVTGGKFGPLLHLCCSPHTRSMRFERHCGSSMTWHRYHCQNCCSPASRICTLVNGRRYVTLTRSERRVATSCLRYSEYTLHTHSM